MTQSWFTLYKLPRFKIYPPLHVQLAREAEIERIKNDPDSEYFELNPKKKLKKMKAVFNIVRLSNYQYRIMSFPESCLKIPFPIFKKVPRYDTNEDLSLFRCRYLTYINDHFETLDGRVNLDKYLKEGKHSSKYLIQYINASLSYFKIIKRRILKNGDISFFIEPHNIITWMSFLTSNSLLRYDEMIDLFAIDILNFNPKEQKYFKSPKELKNARYFVVYNLRSKNYKQRLFIYVYIPEKEYDLHQTREDNKIPYVYPYKKKKMKEPIEIINPKLIAYMNKGKNLKEIKKKKEEEKEFWEAVRKRRKVIPMEMESLCEYFRAANWSEREIWDMFGIFFKKNPDLRRLLTDYSFMGAPLRKDFPLTGFKEISYDENKKTLRYSKVELAQDFREFEFNNPWKI